MDFSKYKRVHCLGIGGIGLSAVAEILRDRGYIVSGTDIHPSKVTRHLEYLGIKVYTSHEPENVEGVDAIVYSAAVSDENPEVPPSPARKVIRQYEEARKAGKGAPMPGRKYWEG